MRSPLAVPYWMIFGAFTVGMVAVCCGVGGDDPSRISVAGRILLNGQSLESGTIRFLLKSYADQPHVDVSLVEGGEYAIPSSESLIPGVYEILIRSAAQEARSRGIKEGGEELSPQDRQWVHPRYNTKSILEVTIQARGFEQVRFRPEELSEFLSSRTGTVQIEVTLARGRPRWSPGFSRSLFRLKAGLQQGVRDSNWPPPALTDQCFPDSPRAESCSRTGLAGRGKPVRRGRWRNSGRSAGWRCGRRSRSCWT